MLLWIIIPIGFAAWLLVFSWIARAGLGEVLGWLDLNLIAALHRVMVRPFGASRVDSGVPFEPGRVLTASSCPGETRSVHTPDEEREIAEVIDRLMKKFPDATRAEVEGAVTVEYLAMGDNPVRDFVPVLVEKQAKKRLKAMKPQVDSAVSARKD